MVCCVGCAVPEKDNRAADTRFIGEERPVQESWNVSMKIFNEDKIHAEVIAGHFAEYKKNDIITRRLDQGVQVIFYNDLGLPSSTLTSERGTVYDNNDMEAFDTVVIRSEDSTVVHTDYIKRFDKEKRLWSDKYVTIDKQGETIRGYGFESDESLKNYTIFKASGEAEVMRR